MAECHPVGFQWVMEAKAARRDGHPRRPAVHPHQRAGRPARAAARRAPTSRSSAAIINYVLSEREVLPRVRARVHQRCRRSSARTSATPRTSTACSPGWTRSTAPTTRRPGSTRAPQVAGRVRRARPGRRTERAAERSRRRRRAARRTAPAARRAPATPDATRRCSTRAACSRCSSGTSPATRRRWSSGSCGVPQELFRRVCELLTENSGRDRTTAFVLLRRLDPAHRRRAVHPHRVDPADRCSATSAARAAASSRCAGTPRSRAPPTSRRCSTCCPATSPMPHAAPPRGPRRATSTNARAGHRASGPSMRAYTGQPAQGVVGRRGDRGQRLLLRLPAAPDRQPQHLRDGDGADRRASARATSCSARTRPSGRRTRKMQRLGMANLDWLVVRDFPLIESATWWKDGPEIETGEMRTEDIGTEVFFLPAAAHTEKDGSFTNTQRLLQWHHQAVEPAGRRAQRPVVHVPPRAPDPGEARRVDRPGGPAGPRPDLGLPGRGRARRAGRRGGARRDQRLGRRRASRCPATRAKPTTGPPPAAAGSTAGATPTGSTRPPGASPATSRAGWRPSGAGPGPPTGASSTTAPRPTRDGEPWSERKAYVWWDAEQEKWTGHDVPDFIADQGRRTTCRREDATGADALARHRPVHHAGRRQGVAVRARRAHRRAAARALRAAGLPDRQPALRPAAQPGAADRLGGTPTTGSHPAATSRAPTSSPTWPPPTGSPSTTPRAG